MIRPLAIVLLATACLSLAGLSVRADDDGDGDEGETLDAVHEGVSKGTLKPLAEIKAIALGRVDGDIVRIEPHRKHGSILYDFRLLKRDGSLVEVEIDAATGRIVETENE